MFNVETNETLSPKLEMKLPQWMNQLVNCNNEQDDLFSDLRGKQGARTLLARQVAESATYQQREIVWKCFVSFLFSHENKYSFFI